MKPLFTVAVLAALTGCTVADRITTAGDPAAVKERELTRRYAFCVKQQLGAFGSFASPESRRIASESCQAVLQPSSASAATP
ncbi:MAG: hypothetical protein AB7F79_09535 [Steroidobacteraceae bacterium]